MTAEGLVELPGHSKRGMTQGWVMAFVLISSAAIVLGTAYVDARYRLAKPKLVGSEKATYSRMTRNATWADGSLARLVEFHHRTRSRVREYVGRPYSSFMLRAFNEPGKELLYGKEGWMYLTDRVVLPDKPVEIGGARSAAEHAALTRRFAAAGVRLVVLPLPRKAAVSGEYLPLGFRAQREVDEALLLEFRKRGVEVIDLLPAWDVPGEEPVYQRRDTHWSTEGLRRSALATVEYLGLLAPEGQRYGEIKKGPERGRPGAMYRLTNTKVRPDEMRYAEKALQSIVVDGEPAKAGGQDASVVVCGTSFSVREVFATFLSHYLGEPIQSFDFRGESPQYSLAKMVAGRAESGLPAIIVEEIPNHLITGHSVNEKSWPLRKPAVELFAALGPKRVLPIRLSTEVLTKGTKLSHRLTTKRSHKVAMIPPGWVAHSGGGCVELAVDLKVQAGQGALVLQQGAMSCTMPCEGSWGRYMLPLIEGRPNADKINLYVKPIQGAKEVEFSVEGLSLVSTVDASTAAPVQIQVPTFLGKQCTQELDFLPGTVGTRQGTLLIETEEGAGRWDDVEVTIENAAGDERQAFTFPMLRQGAWIVLVPGALSGQELGKVTLTGVHQGKGKARAWTSQARWMQVRGQD